MIRSLRTKHPGSHDNNFWQCPLNMAKIAKAVSNHHSVMWPISRVSSPYPMGVRRFFPPCSSLYDSAICIVLLVLGIPAGLPFCIAQNHDREAAKFIVDKRETWDFTAVNRDLKPKWADIAKKLRLSLLTADTVVLKKGEQSKQMLSFSIAKQKKPEKQTTRT